MKRKMVDRPVDVLLNDLRNPAVYVKKTAIMQLEKRKAGQALPLLLELVRDTEASIRSCVAWALGQLGGPGVQAALVGLLEDKDSAVRRAAALSLGGLGDATVMARLTPLSFDADRYVREAARESLLSISKREGRLTLPSRPA